MLVPSLGQLFQRIVNIWLTALVHLDALRSNPCAYLTATKWWIKRRRVRARAQFAPLLSRSPRAYHLWLCRQRCHHPMVASPPDVPVIIALIDTRQDQAQRNLAATQASLMREGIGMLVIGSSETPTLAAGITQIDWMIAPWLLLLNPGDRVSPGTAAAYRAAMKKGNAAKARLLYADDDLLRGRRRQTPHFKPGWNSELFAHTDYITGACLLQATEADLAAVSNYRDWAARLTAKLAGEGTPQHLPAVLHHRQTRFEPRLPAAQLRLAHDLPKISVIVPTRNRVDLLRTCIDGLAATDYPHAEIIIVDNDSDDPDTLAYLAALDPRRHRLLRHCGPFNYSAINNRAVEAAGGRLLCLLNNDVVVTEPQWLAILATQALRPDVGAVGARLLYPDGSIQHAGVVIGIGGGAGHAHRFLRPDEEGYFHRHSLPQFVTAVTGACLVVMRDRFLAAGGLDEVNFPVAFNDVDLCLRLNQKGWQSFYEPRATLIHYESVSRGHDVDPVSAARFAGELAALKRRWSTDSCYDPYHHIYLSRASEQFAVAL